MKTNTSYNEAFFKCEYILLKTTDLYVAYVLKNSNSDPSTKVAINSITKKRLTKLYIRNNVDNTNHHIPKQNIFIHLNTAHNSVL